MAGKYYSADSAASVALGQGGSIIASTDAVTALNGAFVAIQFIEDSVFESGATGLVAETTQLFPDDAGTSTSVSASGGVVSDGITFPAGMTIYGRWSSFELASGKAIAYLG